MPRRDEHSMPQGAGDQECADRGPKHPLDYWIFGFVVLTFFATAMAAFFTGQQWLTANQAMIVSERAFVHSGEISYTPTITKSTGMKYLMTTIILVNSGNTRTRDLKFLVRCATSPSNLVEPWGLLHQEPTVHLPQVIAPK